MDTKSTGSQPSGTSLRKQAFGVLALGALGVVFGDIGTSPLYAFKDCFSGHYSLPMTRENIIGILSLITWSLFMVITFKYICFVLRADNNGQGGTFAMLALLRKTIKDPKKAGIIGTLAIMGAAPLYAESIITPTISVLSAREGISVYTDKLNHFIIPSTLVILFLLFMMQSRGTAKLGKAFGPVMLTWFIVIATLGMIQVFKNPHVLIALNPVHAATFFAHNGILGFCILGSVVLVITGGEALYADMGHFGAKPIRCVWLCLVFPALLMNYYGQGALILTSPEAIANPFFRLVPAHLTLPMVVLATMSTVIASQAMISGIFSITQQAIQLGYLPRMHIIHTSASASGQIYVPFINKLLMCGCLVLVVMFETSSNLAAAYGIAVTAAMCMTSLLFYRVATQLWGWPRHIALPLVCVFLCFDLPFFLSNLLKVSHGGWVTILGGLIVGYIMVVWRNGRAKLSTAVKKLTPTVDDFIHDIEERKVVRVPGTVVVMGGHNDTVPMALSAYVKRSGSLHEQVILITLDTRTEPTVDEEECVSVRKLDSGFVRITGSFGFMQTPDVRVVSKQAKVQYKVNVDYDHSTFFLGRESLVMSEQPKMLRMSRAVFAFMSRNSWNAADFFHLPPTHTIEIGVRLEL